MLHRFGNYCVAGGCSPEVSTFVLSVSVVVPPGAVTVVVFLTSAFFSAHEGSCQTQHHAQGNKSLHNQGSHVRRNQQMPELLAFVFRKE